jgi:6-phosphogluconolactonase
MNLLRKGFSISVLLLLVGLALPVWADGIFSGHVYTMTNAAEGNEILVFDHRSGEGLIHVDTVATGGDGTGGGLGNQGGMVMSQSHRLLFVVNAGSDTVSVLRLGQGSLSLIDTVASGGDMPVSVTQHRDLLYVLNAGSDSIAGFRLDPHGGLTPLAGSVRSLSGAGTAPAQIGFTPLGDMLVVAEKATDRITTFALDADGLPGSPVVNDSAGPTPFGFAFDRYGHLVVSEAAGGAEDASSVSSYDIQEDGTLVTLASAVPTTESAACWVETSRDGRYAFTTNAGSSSISAFKIDPDGTLTLTQPDGVAATTGEGSAPIDLALSRRGSFLYALSANNGTILAYRVTANRFLVPMAGAAGLPTTLNGLAAF